MNFYFTFGSDETFPFKGGWVVVKASSFEEAVEKFKKRYGHENGPVNCAFIYPEDEFKKTKMYSLGNLGYFCHDVIE